MKKEEQKLKKTEGVLQYAVINDNGRDKFAVEAMKVFLTHKGTILKTPLNRLKIFLGISPYRQEVHYNIKNIAQLSFKMADEMIEARTNNQKSE